MLDKIKAEFSHCEAERWVDMTPDQMWNIPWEEVEKIQLAGLQTRFAELITRIPILRKLAAEQNIEKITCFEDLAPLLFRHNVYKSYPMSFLEKADFQRLTRWLDGLTGFDLTGLDASACDTIDDWIALLDSETQIRVLHSSGTTGKLSFLPRSEEEYEKFHLPWIHHFLEGFGAEGDNFVEGIQDLPIIVPSFAKGSGMGQRMLDHIIKYWHRGRDIPVISLYAERLSADALSLGGRLKAAEARGELGQMQISPKLLARREEFMQQFQDAPNRIEVFLDRISALQGQRVLMFGVFAQYYDVAEAAERRGMKNLFAPDSLISMGGGNKGRSLPEGWQKTLAEFLGREIRDGYAMSEVIAGSRKCLHEHYHMQPWTVLYLLDPKTGEVLPRRGTQTGRLGLFDLLPYTYWGGFLSGDEVTISWPDTGSCACGRAGPFIYSNIRRYSEQEGGDDKITCAGTPEAQEKAVQFLIEMAG